MRLLLVHTHQMLLTSYCTRHVGAYYGLYANLCVRLCIWCMHLSGSWCCQCLRLASDCAPFFPACMSLWAKLTDVVGHAEIVPAVPQFYQPNLCKIHGGSVGKCRQLDCSAWKCFCTSHAGMLRHTTHSCWQCHCPVKGTRPVVNGLAYGFAAFCTPFVNNSILVLGAACTHAPKGMLPRLPQLWTGNINSGMKLFALCMHHALGHLNSQLASCA